MGPLVMRHLTFTPCSLVHRLYRKEKNPLDYILTLFGGLCKSLGFSHLLTPNPFSLFQPRRALGIKQIEQGAGSRLFQRLL